MGAGTVSLVKNGCYGILGGVGQVAGGMSKGLALLTLDDQFLERWRDVPLGYQQRLLHAAQTLAFSIADGIVGEML